MSYEIETLSERWDYFFRQNAAKYNKIILGYSGGLDSTVLLHLLSDFTKRKKNIFFSLMHINYGLRGEESAADQHFVEAEAKKLGIKPNIFCAQAAPKTGVQEWARDLRFAYFKKLRDERTIFALAHHNDDLAENFLLRVSRGASLGSAAGMNEWEPPVWRPLLRIPKSQLAIFAQRKKIEFRHDSSNDKLDYGRNRIRHKVIPELENLYANATEKIAKLAREAAEVSDFLQTEIARNYLNNQSKVPTEMLKSLPESLFNETVAMMIKREKHPVQLNSKLLSDLRKKILASTQQPVSLRLPSGLVFEIKGDFCKVMIAPRSQKLARSHQHRANLESLDLTYKVSKGDYIQLSKNKLLSEDCSG